MTGVARITGAQVADALLDYYDLGVTTVLIRSFDPLGKSGSIWAAGDPAGARSLCEPPRLRHRSLKEGEMDLFKKERIGELLGD